MCRNEFSNIILDEAVYFGEKTRGKARMSIVLSVM